VNVPRNGKTRKVRERKRRGKGGERERERERERGREAGLCLESLKQGKVFSS
jgi:hypothetical protein